MQNAAPCINEATFLSGVFPHPKSKLSFCVWDPCTYMHIHTYIHRSYVSMTVQHKNAWLELMPTISIIALRARYAQLTLREKRWLISFGESVDRMVLCESVSVCTSLP